MSGILRSELRKVTTTRLWWLLLICVAVLTVAGCVLPAAVALGPSRGAGAASPFTDPGLVRSVVHGGNPVARALAMVFAIVFVGAEHRYGTLTATALAAPRRLPLAGARAGALLLVGLLFGAVTVVLGLATAGAVVSTYGGRVGLDASATWRSLGLGVVAVALWTLVGLGIGLLVRNLLVAVLVGLGVGFLLESAASAAAFLLHADRLLAVLPTGATNAALGVTAPVSLASPTPLVWWQGALVLAGWCLAPALVGVFATFRRDID